MAGVPRRQLWGVRDRRAFHALRVSPHRARAGLVSVTWAPPVAHETVSVAFALPRRATNAVVRNRMRRRLRGLLGDIDVEPGIYLVSAQPAAATAPAAELRRDLQAALRAVASGKDT